MQRLLIVMGLIFGLTKIVKYRYRVLNVFLGNRWLRRLSVAFVMQIPAVREKMMYQMLR